MKTNLPHRVKNSLLYTSLLGHFALSATAALVLVMSFSSIASALLSGDASLSYTKYDGSADTPRYSCPGSMGLPQGALCYLNADGTTYRVAGSVERNKMSSSSMVQNYSLLYTSHGPIYNSRVGNYDVALGYNYTAVDTSFKYTPKQLSPDSPYNYNETRGHLLYKGEINLDPKEVPFRLNAYSRDMTRNTIVNSTGLGMENFTSIIGGRDQAVGINDGLSIETGVTLVAGVKNGMTNGYNEYLRHLPMILIDFKDTINRDLRAINQVNDRLSRLAFVSLNKKDNWFHYRHIRYDDYINVDNNYTENQVQLGTVDQNMSRRWIDFSNWIKVSTDLEISSKKSVNQDNSFEDMNYNLFATAERNTWNARTFSTFNRFKDGQDKISYTSSLPVYVAGIVNQDLSWNARTSFHNTHDLDSLGVTSKSVSTLAGYRVDAYKRSPFTLSQSFDVESSNTNLSDYVTLSGLLESTSTARFSKDLSLGASYNVKRSSSTNAGSSSGSDFIAQQLSLSGAYALTDTLRFNVRQNNSFSQGSQSSSAVIQSDSYNSSTSLSVSWNPKPRLNTMLTLNNDVFKSDERTGTVSNASATFSFSNDSWTANNNLSYSRGNKEANDASAQTFTNNSVLRYMYSRTLDASASATYSAIKSQEANSSDTIFEQRLNYNYFSTSGIARKLIEFRENLNYTLGTPKSTRPSSKSLTLGGSYYPISRLTLIGNIGYSENSAIKGYALVWNAAVVANFQMLQVSLDYTSGLRTSDKARENKFTGNVRKAF